MATKAKSSKKPQNEKRKSARAASRNRGAERKVERRKAQDERARVNREHRQRGNPTPAEVAYMERRAKRRTVAYIAANGCGNVECGRPTGHKGKHGQPTKTELTHARAAVDAGWRPGSPDRPRGSSHMPRRVTWDAATRNLARRHRHTRG